MTLLHIPFCAFVIIASEDGTPSESPKLNHPAVPTVLNETPVTAAALVDNLHVQPNFALRSGLFASGSQDIENVATAKNSSKPTALTSSREWKANARSTTRKNLIRRLDVPAARVARLRLHSCGLHLQGSSLRSVSERLVSGIDGAYSLLGRLAIFWIFVGVVLQHELSVALLDRRIVGIARDLQRRVQLL
eukprot:CAMPEP_0117592956 /NCGR_PEP_ID=MMETSP0784-20121206/72356_1 /TAXON_ID=39447 /ORGANISM="" /LENGTH=190 /DNA_ID=CAMNT_0005394807 /DNA_START=466 /DNA_END=1038 /DNA_ORIENTATION=+